MKTLPLYTVLPALLLSAPADEVPTFHVTYVSIVPPTPAHATPVLRKDEESGEPAPALIVAAEALIDAKQFENLDVEDVESIEPREPSDEPRKGITVHGPKSVITHFSCELVAADDKKLTCADGEWAYSEAGVLTAPFETYDNFPIQEEYTLRGNLEYTAYAETHRRWYTGQAIRSNDKIAVTVGGFQAKLFSKKAEDGKLGYFLEVKATDKLTTDQLTNLVYKDKSGKIWSMNSDTWQGEDASSFTYAETEGNRIILFGLSGDNSQVSGMAGELIIEVETYAKGTPHKHKIDQKLRLLEQ